MISEHNITVYVKPAKKTNIDEEKLIEFRITKLS